MLPYTSDTVSDFKETFNLNLSKKLGTILTTRLKRGYSFDTEEVPSAFAYFEDAYFAVGGTYLKRGGNAPDDTFSNVTGSNHPSDINYLACDLEEFNGSLFVSGTGNGDGVHRYDGSSWTVVSASGLTGSTKIHLLKRFGDRIYVADNAVIGSIDTSDVLSLTGTATFDSGLSANWVCTMLEASFDSLFIGFNDTDTNKGIIYEWDGSSENQALRKFEIQSGILGGTVLDNVPYYVDVRGRLFRYAGTSFVLVGAVGVESDFSFDGTNRQTVEERPMHPNGITSTDDGNILFLWKNTLVTGQDYDTKPSGVYEYNPEIGVYHKYSISKSTNNGDSRIHKVGAVFQRRPNTSPFENGTLLVGASQLQSASSTDYSGYIFYDDVENSLTKIGYFITKDLWTNNIEDTFKKIYAKHKKLVNSGDKVVVKYRTEPHSRTEAECSWANESRLLTSTDVSNYVQGDEVTVIIGSGAGKSAHIVEIQPLGSGYSILLDEVFTSADGTCLVYFDKWIKAGVSTSSNLKQFTEGTVAKNNQSPYLEAKVYIISASKSVEMNSLNIISAENKKE